MVGGGTQTVRDLVAVWEQRDVMAREVAVDVASHSPQVDPILDELADVLADLEPDDAGGAVLLRDLVDPREQPRCDADYWVGQPAPHGAVRRGGAGGTGGRLPGLRGAGPAPPAHPRRRADRAAASTCRSPRSRHAPRAGAAARAARIRRRRCTARAPRWTSPSCTPAGGWWTRRCRRGRTASCCLSSGQAPDPGARHRSVAVHPLLGAHVRLPEEPERHVWQGDVGTAAHAMAGRPPDPQRGRASRAPPTARWHWRPREPCSVRSPRSATSASSRRCCSTTRFRSIADGDGVDARRRRVRGGDRPGRRARAAAQPPSCMPRRTRAAARTRHRRAARRPSVPHRRRRDCGRRSTASASVRAGLLRSGRGVHRRRDRRDVPPCSPRSRCPGPSARSRRRTASIPALLDACFQSVVVHPQRARGGCVRSAVAARCAPAA